MKYRILVIDDEAGIRDSMRRTLEYQGYQFVGASSGQEGIALIEHDAPDLVFLDIKMPGMDGLEVLDRIKAVHPELPVVMVSGHGTAQTGYDASRRGASGFIEKPFSEPVLLERIQKELGEKTLRSDLERSQTAYRALSRELDARYQMVGTSAALAKVEQAIKRAAPSNATVLLQGESGVGKELVARSIHRDSPRSRERFVQVNCAAIPEDLIESELFGHEKGSFTGATERQIGKFEQADRGTIFLDEVGDMSLKTQAKVLRVLQEGEVERIGSAKTVNVNVRVIAATNKHLESEIEKGSFREDLYFRLAVIPIYVPPLRERPEDIPLLVKHFLNLLARENNRKPKQVTPAAMEALKRYRWRGNIRELRNTIERMIIMTESDAIDVADLPEVVKSDKGAARPGAPGATPAPAAGGSDAGTLREFKESAERAWLVEKLRENAWNISKTAEVIGTPRSNLYKKLEQYAIRQETDG
ncbi:MAG: sigma-54-dependent Fis family transcriptional regulator [Acidobacteria bacterium]|nr:MAG: sigma-54-dependent Fis family transcriptional regulator [Acidobacteriota bacterium]